MEIDSLRQLQNERLHCLVEYAREHSPLFHDLYKNIGDSYTVEDLPITTKSELVARQEEWFADRELTLEMVDEYLASKDKVEKILGKYTALTTSGTTGKPLRMVRDESHNSVHGMLTQTRLLKGIDPKLLTPIESRLACVIFTDDRVSSYLSFKRMMMSFKEYSHNTIAISNLDPIDSIVNRLNDFHPDVLTGYPSVLAEIAREQIVGNLNITPKLVICSAETLLPNHLNLLKQAFNCRVLNNYCSTEGGEIAMSCPEAALHINADWIIVEPIDAYGNIVKDGELSEAVLITDLSNFVQPIIRYKVDDCVRIFNNHNCRCGSQLPIIEIQSRKCEVFQMLGNEINTLHLVVGLCKIEGLYSFQIIRISEDSLEFRCMLSPEMDHDILKKVIYDKMISIFKNKGYKGINFSIVEKPIIKSKTGGKAKHFLSLEEYLTLSNQ